MGATCVSLEEQHLWELVVPALHWLGWPWLNKAEWYS